MMQSSGVPPFQRWHRNTDLILRVPACWTALTVPVACWCRRLRVVQKRLLDHRKITEERLEALEARLRADNRILPAMQAALL